MGRLSRGGFSAKCLRGRETWSERDKRAAIITEEFNVFGQIFAIFTVFFSVSVEFGLIIEGGEKKTELNLVQVPILDKKTTQNCDISKG